MKTCVIQSLNIEEFEPDWTNTFIDRSTLPDTESRKRSGNDRRISVNERPASRSFSARVTVSSVSSWTDRRSAYTVLQGRPYRSYQKNSTETLRVRVCLRLASLILGATATPNSLMAHRAVACRTSCSTANEPERSISSSKRIRSRIEGS